MNTSARNPLDSNESEPGKRTLLLMFAAFAALTLSVVSVSLGAKALRAEHRVAPAPSTGSHRSHADEIDPRIKVFLGPLANTRQFDTWRITRIDPLQFGRMTLEIEGDVGGGFVVDIHAKSAQSPQPITETTTLALYVRIRTQQTPEAFVRGCRALAEQLRQREEAGFKPPPLEALLPK